MRTLCQITGFVEKEFWSLSLNCRIFRCPTMEQHVTYASSSFWCPAAKPKRVLTSPQSGIHLYTLKLIFHSEIYFPRERNSLVKVPHLRICWMLPSQLHRERMVLLYPKFWWWRRCCYWSVATMDPSPGQSQVLLCLAWGVANTNWWWKTRNF